ncbi:MAG: hypothetical protein OEU32_01100 [Acidimicrobiia bacterium]|nr:hypothetical protein [Acidimicrobiia bacterium]
MLFVANIVSLLLVLAIVWFGMRWLTRRVHGHLDIDAELESLSEPGDPRPCIECGGVGARQQRGSLRPCPACEGTGVQNASF